ncbi:MAG: chloride channel protein [Lachnospiraceae bacterium]|nr:chloride channel protein [Lachnospiraceae bacterium]MDE6252241.1 chloride channel protein [Lachnospiraceae bacterium]
MDIKIKNRIYLYAFCTILGSFTGIVIWVFLKVLSAGTSFIWEWLPARIHIPFYTLLVCTAGGILIGIIHKKYGDYPEELSTVLSKMKKEKFYEYRNMKILIISALFPLVIGSSVGPEAGLTGIIVGLCCWAVENLKFAHKNAKEYSEIGMAVTLSVLFHSPLFGIFAVEEVEQEQTLPELTRTSKIFIYGLALAAGTGTYLILNALFGVQMEGFPSFPAFEPEGIDYLMIVIYIICGCLLANFYQLIHYISHKIAGKIPSIVKETIGGLCLGIIGLLVPAVMFSGEEQMGTLMENYSKYIPLCLIGIAFLKILMTNICIESGLKGGHFFPVIFAGVCMGYGIAGLVFSESAGHVVLGAAIVTAALLGGIMKKPLAVTMLLFLCFPVKMFVWIFLAALIGSKGIVKM